ncbi:MAG TPA: glycoside hydrolase family 38 C-terminal domain-containing protein [Ignavibacteriaceae bacterium]|nr:glycoside hydrolase family 38 C-terminal domain-containing protein [Ignavibacteriaceae bacterium]
MKSLKYFLVLSLFPLLIFAQNKKDQQTETNVDKVAKRLSFLSTYAYDDWKKSPNLSGGIVIEGDPTSLNFDDSKWGTLSLNEHISDDSCWLRKTVVLPKQILGVPVKGKVKLMLSVDDYGYLWINGESKGYFPWDGDFVLTENAKPGDKFVVVIKAINTGGPLRLIRAELDMGVVTPLREEIQDLALSLRTGQKLLSFDTYQTNARVKTDPGIDKSNLDKNEKIKLNNLLQEEALKIDVSALEAGDLTKYKESVEEVKKALVPVAAFAKKFTLYFDSNAHIDAAWLWRSKETKLICRNTFASVLHIMDEKPIFTYTQSAAQYFQWMQNLYPDVFNGIKARIKDGRWEIVGGMWIEPDCNLPSGVSWNRQLLYAKNYFKNEMGVDVKLGWNPDSFGYNWNMPMFYKNAGIDAFITQKIGWNDTNVFPYRLFWWESPDGSKILSYFPFDYVNTITQSYQLVDWLRQFEANTGFRNFMILFGVGDHGGGPSIDMITRVEHLMNVFIYPKIQYGTAQNYINLLKKQDLSKLPVWDDELYLEYHRGTYTSHGKIKKYNRKMENLLAESEKFSSISSFYGNKYPEKDLGDAWKDVMFNQFHDILPGSSIREVYIDAVEKFEKAEKIGDFTLNAALTDINKNINTTGIKDGSPLTVFNPLNWKRTDIVKFNLPEGDENNYSVFTEEGREIPSQMVNLDHYTNQLMFIATDVPSIGYKTYVLKKNKTTLTNSGLSATETKIDNQYFTVAIDTSTGWVKNIYDKRNNKEIFKNEGNKLQLLEDTPKNWDAWNIGLTGVEYPSNFRKAEVIETGPVRTIVRLHRDYLKPGVVKDYPTPNFPSSFFTQDVILYNGLDRIDFQTKVDWWEEHTMLKVAFPFSFSDTMATYEIPYGSIQRSTESKTDWQKARFEVAAEKWADMTSGDYGVSLLNNSKYGYDTKDNVMRLSLLRSPKWPDPTQDMGKHTIDYALYPHKGDWKSANTVQRGWEYNEPLIASMNSIHPGNLPLNKSFIKLNEDNLVLTTVKKAEGSGAWVIQWYDAEGRETEATITLPAVPKKVLQSNFMEEDGKPIEFNGSVVKVKTKKHSVETIKVYF